MKKFMVTLLAIMTSLMLVVGVVGCGAPKTSSATELGIVHKSYLGVVDITVNKEGKVSSIKVDEIFLPSQWAKTAEGENASFVNQWTVNGEQTDYAQYIKIGDKYFEAKSKAENSTTPVWEEIDGDIKDLEKELGESAELRDWYYKAAKEGKVSIVKAVDNGFEKDKDAANNAYGNMFKSQSTYWPEDHSVGIGWKANIKAIEDYVKENGVNYEMGDLEKDGDTNTWWIGDVDTGASLTDFTDYMAVVKAAYEKAMKAYK
jgi:hypothetical protein